MFLTGSYVRGDWLDASSDLDVNLLYDAERGSVEADLATLRGCLEGADGPSEFPSQCPGGIDWSVHPRVPETPAEVATPSPFALFGVFYFDLLEHSVVVWGEDVRARLPLAPDPRPLVAPSLRASLARLEPLADLADALENRRRSAFAAYRAAAMLQLRFGERTLDKRRLPGLYRRHVPSFAYEALGAEIIEARLTARYPDRPPAFLDSGSYREFVRAALELAERAPGRPPDGDASP